VTSNVVLLLVDSRVAGIQINKIIYYILENLFFMKGDRK
jgi:hypothetical protein